MSITVGEVVPQLEVEAYVRDESEPRRIAMGDYRDRWLVLFFYPRDFTFICPTEIQAFGALEADFGAHDAVVVGASTDSSYVHKAWYESDARLVDITFPVVADTAHELSRAFGVLGANGAALRATFIIDPDGVVQHASITTLNVGRNVDEVLRCLQALQTGELCPAGWREGDAFVGPELVAA